VSALHICEDISRAVAQKLVSNGTAKNLGVGTGTGRQATRDAAAIR
jgi:hypothetical protein